MNDSSISQPQDQPLAVPPPPRPITPRARRRSWNEAPVRVWAILTVLVIAAITYFALTHIVAAAQDRWLIQHGTPAQARVTRINDLTQTARPFDRRELLVVELEIDPTKPHLHGPLMLQPGSLRVGDTIPIRIDPDHPERWTDRTQPRSWLVELTAVFFLLPLLVLTIAALLLNRRRVLKVWRSGEPAVAVVVDTKQSSIAPRSRVMRFALRDSDDRRVFSTLAPNRMGDLSAGDEVMILHPRGNPARAVIAELYV